MSHRRFDRTAGSVHAKLSDAGNRRAFLKTLGMTGIGASIRGSAEARGSTTTRVAAVQMEPRLGDVEANMRKAESMVREAIDKGAKLVLLPEFFTSGLAMDQKMFDAHRPIDGAPLLLLKKLAKEGNALVGGSFLAKSADDVYNSFVLALPDGLIFSHDKDFPSTNFESSFYAAGEDAEFVRILTQQSVKTADARIPSRPGNNSAGVFELDNLRVGVAICWEQARFRTARRLRGKVDLVLAASAWWYCQPDADWPGLSKEDLKKGWAHQKHFIQEAPRRLARMLGVPVVHVNMVGANPGFLDTAFKVPVMGRYLGESQILDGHGKTLAALADVEGIVMADLSSGNVEPSEEIPEDFWIPEMDAEARKDWYESGASGRDFYLKATRPHRNQG